MISEMTNIKMCSFQKCLKRVGPGLRWSYPYVPDRNQKCNKTVPLEYVIFKKIVLTRKRAEHSMHNRNVNLPIFQMKTEKVSKSKLKVCF